MGITKKQKAKYPEYQNVHALSSADKLHQAFSLNLFIFILEINFCSGYLATCHCKLKKQIRKAVGNKHQRKEAYYVKGSHIRSKRGQEKNI